LICLVLVTAPTIVLLVICACLTLALALFGGDRYASPMNLLAVIIFPVPLMLILLFEYHAVIKKSAAAALLVGAVFLFPVIPGIISLSDGISGFVGVSEPHPDYADWPNLAVVAASVAVATFIGIVHLRWWRRLVRWHYATRQDESDVVE
jgi:hypothetical protein